MLSNYKSIEEMVEMLGEEWKTVRIWYRPDYEDFEIGEVYVVRNKTDEGLPTGSELQKAEGGTLREALEKAVDEYVV